MRVYYVLLTVLSALAACSMIRGTAGLLSHTVAELIVHDDVIVPDTTA